jgi:hypothetical protein
MIILFYTCTPYATFGVKEEELALMSSVLLELASWLWLAVGLFVESYVDHEPKQQNPQHFHTFILHDWWMVSKSFIIEILHEQLKVWLSSLKSCRLVRVTLTCFL